MKKLFLKMSFVTFLAMIMTAGIASAQETSEAEKAVMKIVQKYENTEGVESVVATKGNGLWLIKKMLTSQFGKDFMKGVTSITVINYTSASPETCSEIRKDVDVFTSMLQEFDAKEEFSDSQFVRIFAAASESKTLSDFVIASEDESAKMLMHMAGNIEVAK